MKNSVFDSEDLKKYSIRVHEPFSEFLRGSQPEHSFEISLLDVVRFAGHACPSVVGAFLITKMAVEELFPGTGICERGDVAVELPFPPTAGATGPISNVFSFITGAWGETGFGGLQGKFARRGLLKFAVHDVPEGSFRFTRLSTGKSVDVIYNPSQAAVALDPEDPFQIQWRKRIASILENPGVCMKIA